ncbi:MAG: F0F1 ATP synthase subunit A [Clostridia bacterium]|nr:F0F1 ATP synthase subunit A [Clostridia bacterium]
MTIKVLTTPASEGISISGARILCTIPMPLQDLIISEAQVNSWLIMITIFGFCLFITHGIKADRRDWRQLAAEWMIEKLDGLLENSMEEIFRASYAPFIGTILAISACSSLMSLFGVFPPTADVNVIAGWSILVFALITKNKLKAGFGNYAKGFLEPIPVMLPMNILGEIATPVSMTFRHFGNVMSGTVIATLIAWALQNLSSLVLGWLPGFLGDIPFLQIGLPAVLSVYFDVFSGCIQAYIFAMLTMLNISGAYPADAIAERLAKREARKAKKAKVA